MPSRPWRGLVSLFFVLKRYQKTSSWAHGEELDENGLSVVESSRGHGENCFFFFVVVASKLPLYALACARRARRGKKKQSSSLPFSDLSPCQQQKTKKTPPAAATLVRADPPFISGGDSSFVPGISAVQIGGDLYQPATLTLDGVAANAGAATTVRAAATTRGSRAARAGRKMLDDAAPAQQATTEQPQQSNGNTVIIQGEEYVKVSGR